ncbi:MAG: lysophospholipid acyltransferase family protein [Deltaproteobacteria bacterium]|nr:lysophospholipid acyltransferase family protein [Deltaproteobacteria bacterium]
MAIAQTLLKYRLVPLCYYLLRLYLSFLRVRVVGEEAAHKQFSKYGRVIAAVFHQRFLPALAYVTKFRNFKPIVMISQSSDGELIASLASRLGLVPVRGSSTRGGRDALMAILRALKKNPGVIHIVDGPTGPKGVVKPGLMAMAQVAGAPIFPVIISAEKAWVMRSWDRFLVPKPFSKVTIRWGDPFPVPRGTRPEQLEELRKQVESLMLEAHAEADLKSGWRRPL